MLNILHTITFHRTSTGVLVPGRHCITDHCAVQWV